MTMKMDTNEKYLVIATLVVLAIIIYIIYSNDSSSSTRMDKMEEKIETMTGNLGTMNGNMVEIATHIKKLNLAVHSLSARDDMNEPVESLLEDVDEIQRSLEEQGLLRLKGRNISRTKNKKKSDHKSCRLRYLKDSTDSSSEDEDDSIQPIRVKRKARIKIDGKNFGL